MKSLVNENLLNGDENPYCHKTISGCYCKIGWPYEKMCPKCRDDKNRDIRSYCVCPPPCESDK
jgi:hypothetical protein